MSGAFIQFWMSPKAYAYFDHRQFFLQAELSISARGLLGTAFLLQAKIWIDDTRAFSFQWAWIFAEDSAQHTFFACWLCWY